MQIFGPVLIDYAASFSSELVDLLVIETDVDGERGIQIHAEKRGTVTRSRSRYAQLHPTHLASWDIGAWAWTLNSLTDRPILFWDYSYFETRRWRPGLVPRTRCTWCSNPLPRWPKVCPDCESPLGGVPKRLSKPWSDTRNLIQSVAAGEADATSVVLELLTRHFNTEIPFKDFAKEVAPEEFKADLRRKHKQFQLVSFVSGLHGSENEPDLTLNKAQELSRSLRYYERLSQTQEIALESLIKHAPIQTGYWSAFKAFLKYGSVAQHPELFSLAIYRLLHNKVSEQNTDGAGTLQDLGFLPLFFTDPNARTISHVLSLVPDLIGQDFARSHPEAYVRLVSEYLLITDQSKTDDDVSRRFLSEYPTRYVSPTKEAWLEFPHFALTLLEHTKNFWEIYSFAHRIAFDSGLEPPELNETTLRLAVKSDFEPLIQSAYEKLLNQPLIWESFSTEDWKRFFEQATENEFQKFVSLLDFQNPPLSILEAASEMCVLSDQPQRHLETRWKTIRGARVTDYTPPESRIATLALLAFSIAGDAARGVESSTEYRRFARRVGCFKGRRRFKHSPRYYTHARAIAILAEHHGFSPSDVWLDRLRTFDTGTLLRAYHIAKEFRSVPVADLEVLRKATLVSTNISQNLRSYSLRSISSEDSQVRELGWHFVKSEGIDLWVLSWIDYLLGNDEWQRVHWFRHSEVLVKFGDFLLPSGTARQVYNSFPPYEFSSRPTLRNRLLMTTFAHLFVISDPNVRNTIYQILSQPDLFTFSRKTFIKTLASIKGAPQRLWESFGEGLSPEAKEWMTSSEEFLRLIGDALTVEQIAASSSAQQDFLIAYLEVNPQRLRRDHPVAAACAMIANPRIQTMAITELERSGQMNRVWLSLAESGLPPGLDAARRYLNGLRHEEALTTAVLAAIDSQVEATRDLGLEVLDSRRKSVDEERVWNALAESDDPVVRARVAEESLVREWPDETRLDDFDRRVLVTRHTGRATKEKVKQRLETPPAYPTEVRLEPQRARALLELAEGRAVADREWALQRLAILQLQGVHLGGLDVRLTTEGSDQ